MRARRWLLLLTIVAALLLGACGSQVTPSPEIPFPTIPTAIPPTPHVTPVPTAPPVSPVPSPACLDRAAFDSDVTVPPGTAFLPGQSFVKTWRLRNAGTCTWTTDYALVFYTGDRMAGAAIVPFPVAVPEGSTVDLSVALVAPAGAGTYEGRWRLQNAGGVPFGIVESTDGSFGVRIVVQTTPTTPVTPTVPVTASPGPTTTPLPTATPTAGPTPIITAWKGEYFANAELAGSPALVRDDTAVDFDWGGNAPADGLPADAFSVRWTRTLPFEAGPYRFSATVDDGVRLWVDNHLVIDDWRDGSQREVIGDWTVTSGNHDIRIEYYDRANQAVVRVAWDNLSEIYPDWRGQYWSNATLSGSPALVQNEGTIDFNWGAGSFAAGMPADNFSARWMRVASFDAATYRFHIVMDDGARLWVDENLVVDSWQDGGFRETAADVTLAAGAHLVRVEYYERGGDAQLRLWWEKR